MSKYKITCNSCGSDSTISLNLENDDHKEMDDECSVCGQTYHLFFKSSDNSADGICTITHGAVEATISEHV